MPNSDRWGFLKNSSGITKKVAIKIPSDIKYIRKVSGRILGDLAPYNMDESLLFDIRLCVEEAVRNAIDHGNNSDKHLPVKVAYWVSGSELNIEVEDSGKGFDHRQLPDPTDGNNIMRNSGRGVYLIKKLMNQVVFNETGNKILMTKYLNTEKS